MNERLARAVQGWRIQSADSPFEIDLSETIRTKYDLHERLELYARFAHSCDPFDGMMRRAIWRASAAAFGHGVQIGAGVKFDHIETFEVGDSVQIGANTVVRGRPGGRCSLGNSVWIGPDCVLDARDIVLEEFVSWGTGARVVGGKIENALVVERGADIGEHATIMCGVRIGSGAMVLAHSIVTENVRARAVASGGPAKFVQWREDVQRMSPFPPDELEELFRIPGSELRRPTRLRAS